MMNMTSALARFAIFAIALLFVCGVAGVQADDDLPWRAGQLALSHNGRHLAVLYVLEFEGERHTEYELQTWLYDLAQPLKPPQFVLFGESGGTVIIFSPDDTLLALGNYLNLKVYDVATLESVLELTNSRPDTPADFRWIYFSPDSKYIMAFTDWWARDLDMHVWNIETGEQVSRVEADRSQQWIERPWLSPDWRQFLQWHAGPDRQSIVYGFDPETGLSPSLAAIDARGEGQAAFSPDSSLFAIVKSGGLIELHDTATWTLNNSVKIGGHNCDERMSFSFSKGRPLLALTCTTDDRLAIWDYEAGEVILEVRTRGSVPRFTRDDSRVVVETRFSGIQVWTIEDSREMTVYPGGHALLHPNGELMITIGPDGYVWIWNISLKRVQLILPLYAG